MHLWTTVLVLLISTCAYVLGQDCRPERAQACHAPASTYFQNGSFVMAENREDLYKVCRELQSMLACFENFRKDCITRLEDQWTIAKMFSGIEAYVNDLCQPNSPLVEDYLRHAPCMVRAEPKVRHCSEKVMMSLQKIPHLQGQEAQREAAKILCCEMGTMSQCLVDGYEKECGTESIQLSKKSIAVVLNPMEEAMCGAMDKTQCSSADFLHHSTFAVLMSLVATLWLWLRH